MSVKLIHPLDAMVLFRYCDTLEIDSDVKSIGFVPDGAEFKWKGQHYRQSVEAKRKFPDAVTSTS